MTATTSTTPPPRRPARRWWRPWPTGWSGRARDTGDPGRVHSEGRGVRSTIEAARRPGRGAARDASAPGRLHLGRDRGRERRDLGGDPGTTGPGPPCSPTSNTPRSATPRRGGPVVRIAVDRLGRVDPGRGGRRPAASGGAGGARRCSCSVRRPTTRSAPSSPCTTSSRSAGATTCAVACRRLHDRRAASRPTSIRSAPISSRSAPTSWAAPPGSGHWSFGGAYASSPSSSGASRNGPGAAGSRTSRASWASAPPPRH